MGLRDYKKSQFGVMGWKNKLSGLLVTIEETSIRSYGRGFIIKVISNGRRVHLSKKFKTIKQATAYAKAYMRKH